MEDMLAISAALASVISSVALVLTGTSIRLFWSDKSKKHDPSEQELFDAVVVHVEKLSATLKEERTYLLDGKLDSEEKRGVRDILKTQRDAIAKLARMID